jgi:hypothetical protein
MASGNGTRIYGGTTLSPMNRYTKVLYVVEYGILWHSRNFLVTHLMN